MFWNLSLGMTFLAVKHETPRESNPINPLHPFPGPLLHYALKALFIYEMLFKYHP